MNFKQSATMKDTFYFQHDYNARNDPKLQRLLMKHGAEGIGIYWCLVEMLYEQGGQLENNLIDVIAYNLHVNETTLRSVVFELNLFVFDDTHFWSERIRQKTTERNNFKTTQKQRSSKGGAPLGNKNASKSKICEEINEEEKQPKTTQNNPTETTENNSNNQNNPIIKENKIRGNKIIDIEESIEAKRTAFVPPTQEEVEAYVQEKGYSHFDTERFIDFYTSKGWMIGKNKMKDWQASVRGWYKRSTEDQAKQPHKSHASINDEWRT